MTRARYVGPTDTRGAIPVDEVKGVWVSHYISWKIQNLRLLNFRAKDKHYWSADRSTERRSADKVDRQTGRQTGRQADRQTDRQTYIRQTSGRQADR